MPTRLPSCAPSLDVTAQHSPLPYPPIHVPTHNDGQPSLATLIKLAASTRTLSKFLLQKETTAAALECGVYSNDQDNKRFK